MPTITDILNKSETIQEMMEEWGYTDLRIAVPSRDFDKNKLHFMVTIPEGMSHNDLATFQLDLKRKLNCWVCVETSEIIDEDEFREFYKFPEDKKAIQTEFSGVEFRPHEITKENEVSNTFMFDTFVYRGLEQQRNERNAKRMSTGQNPLGPDTGKKQRAADPSSSDHSSDSTERPANTTSSSGIKPSGHSPLTPKS
jgi:hypothetical protein